MYDFKDLNYIITKGRRTAVFTCTITDEVMIKKQPVKRSVATMTTRSTNVRPKKITAIKNPAHLSEPGKKTSLPLETYRNVHLCIFPLNN